MTAEIVSNEQNLAVALFAIFRQSATPTRLRPMAASLLVDDTSIPSGGKHQWWQNENL
ncbi:hypothetical protein PanWU01x14_349470, partial [Parasponia andersonii]